MKKRILLCTALCTALLAGAVFLFFTGTGGAGIPCMINALTGFFCAGCGTSRALRSVLHLQFYQAFRYNPMLVILLPFIIVYICARMIDYIRTGRNNVDSWLSFRLVWWIAILVVAYSVVRNFPFFPFTLLVPTVV